MRFTDEQQRVFERDGVIELGQVLTLDTLLELRDRLDALLFVGPDRLAGNVVDLSVKSDEPLTDSVLYLTELYRKDPVFCELAQRGDLLDVVEGLIGPDVLLFRDQIFYKPAWRGGTVYMHQDNRYWHIDPPQAVTVWIALDDATVENGCVHFVKGSHRWGRVEHRRAANGKSILLEAEVDQALATPIEVPAGHATVHHCQTVHFSPPNGSGQMRRAHTIEYMSARSLCRGEPRPDLLLLRGTRPAMPAANITHASV
jgi:ectoine hydroxylase-related dioxygenase (phytanoyl-CoA dioxygenase family)